MTEGRQNLCILFVQAILFNYLNRHEKFALLKSLILNAILWIYNLGLLKRLFYKNRDFAGGRSLQQRPQLDLQRIVHAKGRGQPQSVSEIWRAGDP